MTDDYVAAAEISKWKTACFWCSFVFVYLDFFLSFFLRETNFLLAEKCHSALIKGRQALLNISLQLSEMKSFLFLFFFFHLTCRFDVNLPFQAAVACLTGSSHTDAKTAQSWVKCAPSFLPSLRLQKPGSVAMISSLLGSS